MGDLIHQKSEDQIILEEIKAVIIFQSKTSDVAWIPREGEMDRFYVRMDRKEFSIDEAIAKALDFLLIWHRTIKNTYYIKT